MGIVDAWETKGQIAMLNGNTGYFWLVCASCEKCMLYFWTPLTASALEGMDVNRIRDREISEP